MRYDRSFNVIFSIFTSELVESNRFLGFSRRYNTDVGTKYVFYLSKKNKSFFEVGHHYTLEKKMEQREMEKDSKARLFVESKYLFNKNSTGKLWVEYLYNFTEPKDAFASTEASMTVAITDMFSTKLAYKWLRDNDPEPGNSKYDYVYTTSLIASF